MTTFKITDEGRTFKRKFVVSSGGVGTIPQGTPTKMTTIGAIVPMVDGNGTTSERFTGISTTLSTDMAAADGEVYIFEPFAEMVYTGSPKSATAANTAAKIDALKGKRVVFDLTGTTWTIDSAAADSATNCVIIVGGTYQDNLLDFAVMSKGIYLYA